MSRFKKISLGLVLIALIFPLTYLTFYLDYTFAPKNVVNEVVLDVFARDALNKIFDFKLYNGSILLGKFNPGLEFIDGSKSGFRVRFSWSSVEVLNESGVVLEVLVKPDREHVSKIWIEYNFTSFDGETLSGKSDLVEVRAEDGKARSRCIIFYLGDIKPNVYNIVIDFVGDVGSAIYAKWFLLSMVAGRFSFDTGFAKIEGIWYIRYFLEFSVLVNVFPNNGFWIGKFYFGFHKFVNDKIETLVVDWLNAPPNFGDSAMGYSYHWEFVRFKYRLYGFLFDKLKTVSRVYHIGSWIMENYWEVNYSVGGWFFNVAPISIQIGFWIYKIFDRILYNYAATPSIVELNVTILPTFALR